MKLEATHMRCRSWCRLSRGLHPCSVYAARKPRGGREQQDALSERSSLRDTAYSPNPGATLSTQLAAKATLLCLDRFHRAVEVVERKWGGGEVQPHGSKRAGLSGCKTPYKFWHRLCLIQAHDIIVHSKRPWSNQPCKGRRFGIQTFVVGRP